MNNTNFKISSPFLSCFNNLSGLYFEALVSRFWRGLVGSKFLLFHGSEEESVYRRKMRKTILKHYGWLVIEVQYDELRQFYLTRRCS